MTEALSRLATALDPALLMLDLGFVPDPWQAEALRSEADRLLLLCARQVGKSTVVAVLALGEVIHREDALVLLVSPSQRQSGELFRKVVCAYDALGRPVPAVQDSAVSLTLANGSRVVSLPGNPATIRGFSAPRLVVVDEAAQVADTMLAALSPMLAVGGGRLVALSTPFGQRGWFFDQWAESQGRWHRIRATASDCPRIDAAWLAAQRPLLLGERW